MTDGDLPLGHRYLLHEVIGRGATGEVYRATTRDTGETVAAKVLRPGLAGDEDVVARFVQERRILQRISSPNVVALRDLVVEADTLAIVTDLVAGPNLRTYLEGRGTLAPAEAADLVAQVLRGLAAAHELGAVHRDVKPENVLMDLSGPRPKALLSDFGVARMAHGSGSSRLTALVGTVAYLAPELAEDARPTAAADVWSCGVMLYELLSGVTPFAAGNLLAMIRAAVEREAPPIPGAPGDLWRVLSTFLAKAPGDRPGAAVAAGELQGLGASLAGLPALPKLEAPAQPEAAVAGGWGRMTAGGGGDLPTIQGPVTGRGTPVATAPPAPAPPAARRRPRLLAGTIAGGVALVVAVAVVVVLVNRTPPAASQSFPPVLIGGSVSAQRVWRLSGDRLSASVVLRNAGAAPQDVTWDEVVPDSVAAAAADLHGVGPPGFQVVRADPVLRWAFAQLAPASVRTITYDAAAGGPGSARARLARLVADQKRDEALYDAQAHIAIRVLNALAVSPAPVALVVGRSQALSVTGTFDDGSPAPAGAFVAQFSSADAAVASVDAAGTVRAVGPGATVVSAAVGSVSAGVTVTVAAPQSAVRPSAPAAPPGRSPPPQPGPPTPAPLPATPAPLPTTPAPSPSAVPRADDYGTGPAVEVAPNGVQGVYWKGTDGNLWAVVFDGKNWGSAVNLGMGPLGSEPTVGTDGAGHVWAYWRGTDGQLVEGWFDGAKWNGPVAFPQFGTLGSQPSVAVASSSRQYVFWRGKDGNLVEAYWSGTAWAGPIATGVGPLNSSPGATIDAAEHPFVYWKGTDGDVWGAAYDGVHWAGPVKVVTPPAPIDSAPAAFVTSASTQAVFWRGEDRNLWVSIFDTKTWSAPLPIGMGPMGSGPTVGIDNAGHDWVYWKGTTGQLELAAWDGTRWVGPLNVPNAGTLG